MSRTATKPKAPAAIPNLANEPNFATAPNEAPQAEAEPLRGIAVLRARAKAKTLPPALAPFLPALQDANRATRGQSRRDGFTDAEKILHLATAYLMWQEGGPMSDFAGNGILPSAAERRADLLTQLHRAIEAMATAKGEGEG